MRIDENGTYYAETPDELAQLFQMATGREKGNVGINNKMSPEEMLMGLGLTYPGTKDLFGLDPVNVDLDSGGGRLNTKPSRVEQVTSKIKNSKPVGNAKSFLSGLDDALDAGATKQVKALQGLIPQGPSRAGMPAINRFAGNALSHPAMKIGLKYAPVVGTALAAGDLLLGDDSIANKGMDAALMGIGGVIGSGVPVVGTALGATAGKMLSDGIQFIGGGGKSPEERRLEEALAQLGG